MVAPIDIAGVRSGRLVAVERVGSDRHGRALWRCACDCGGSTETHATAIRKNRCTSCGCGVVTRDVDLPPAALPSFWQSVDRSDGCWVWIGRRDRHGYGQFRVGRAIRQAHRVAWRLAHGPLPPGLYVCHRCDNRVCVRPDHLFLGTNADNMRDMVAKGRQSPIRHAGERNPNAKLSAPQVLEIRLLAAEGVTQAELGRRYGVRKNTISTIVRGRNWTSVASRGI